MSKKKLNKGTKTKTEQDKTIK